MLNNSKEKQLSNKKDTVKKKKNALLFPTDFSKFDTSTGEKIADDSANNDNYSNRSLAKMEAVSEAKETRTSPRDNEETLKDAATGGSLSYLVANPTINKDSKKLKWLTAGRKRGLVGLVGAAAAGALSLRKQKGEYNKQQASRELLSNKKTGRSIAYREYLKNKYSLQG